MSLMLTAMLSATPGMSDRVTKGTWLYCVLCTCSALEELDATYDSDNEADYTKMDMVCSFCVLCHTTHTCTCMHSCTHVHAV